MRIKTSTTKCMFKWVTISPAFCLLMNSHPQRMDSENLSLSQSNL